jgi:hypothetical protein
MFLGENFGMILCGLMMGCRFLHPLLINGDYQEDFSIRFL